MVLKKDIQLLNRLALECPPNERFMYLGDALSLAERLLKERDAYRQIALTMVELDSTNIDDVDKEAARIIRR